MLLHQTFITEKKVYIVTEKIGRGTTSDVYRVKHSFLGDMAMKVANGFDSLEMNNKFVLQESKRICSFKHPNVINVFDAGMVRVDNHYRAFYTMEHCSLGTLENFCVLHNEANTPITKYVDIVIQIGMGLSYIHTYGGIVHCDINPQNILIDESSGRLKAVLSDFGVARKIGFSMKGNISLGCLSTKPPDFFYDDDMIAYPSYDVFGLGVILYFLVTKRLPYHTNRNLDWRKNIENWGIPDEPSLVNKLVDEKLQKIIMRSIDLHADMRYNAADEFVYMN